MQAVVVELCQSIAPACRIFILQRGRVVYFGDNGDAATAYFTQTLPEVSLAAPLGD